MTTWTPPSDAEATLRTERLLLRPPRPDDAPLVFPSASDPALTRHMSWTAHRDPAETKAFLESCAEQRAAARGWTWIVLEGGRFRGVVGVAPVVRMQCALRLDRGELGYWIGLPFHGRGLGTEAAAAVTAFAFRRLALHKVIAFAVTENPASLRVLAKLGFTSTGIRRRDVERDGRWYDLAGFEMLEDDPAARRLQADLPDAR